MKRLRGMAGRFAGLFHKDRAEREMAEEFESHLTLQVQDNLRAGMTPEQARREALRQFGGIESAKEQYRDRSTLPWVEHLVQDLRFALRQLRKHPGFAVTAILVLAIGTGASLAIFTFVDAALLKPLPYRNPTELVAVTESVAMIPDANLSYLDYLDWKRMNQVFSSLDVSSSRGYLLRTTSKIEVVPGTRVSDGFFRTLGVAPALGRDFYQGEDLPAAPRTVILSYGAWQKRFAGRNDILGQSVVLSDAPYTVIGVLPKDFQFAPRGDIEFWTTLHPEGSCDLRRSCHNLKGIARLKEGVSVETALAATKAVAKQLELQYPDSNRGQGAWVVPLSENIIGEIRPILLLLLGGALLLLLIGWINVSSLLLVRSEARRREFAVRGAVGASGSRLVLQFVTEGVLLAAIGCVLGVVISIVAVRALLGAMSEDLLFNMPYLNDLHFGRDTALLAVGIFIFCAVLLAIPPILRIPTTEIRSELAQGGRSFAGTLWRRVGSNLVVVELAIAVVLLVGAGLLGESLYKLLRVDLGFDADNLATMSLRSPMGKYAKNEQQVELAREVKERLSALPGITSVGMASILPVSFNGNTDWIRFVGKPWNGEHNEVNGRDVSAEYFPTIKAKLLRGRFFRDDDDATKHKFVIINRALAEKYFPGEDPIGKQIGNLALAPDSIKEIVGVVDNIREGPLDSDIWPAVYYPFNQSPDSEFWLVARTTTRPELVLSSIVTSVHSLDPEIATIGVASMNERIHQSQTAYLRRSSAWMIGGYAALATLLGVIGLYGVIAYSVSQRTREIGVRMALGAQPTAVYRLILREAGWLTTAGISIGIVLAVIAASLIKKLLFGVASWDISTLTGVAICLGTCAFAASFVPARRAASVNPVEALRSE